MTETYDDDDRRGQCKACLFAKRAGAPGDKDHEDLKGRTHKVYVSETRPKRPGSSLWIWTLQAACGETFLETIDSGD